ncbi:MAG: hypothetical protein RIQ53_2243 [Pseudomonadota bacterium]
MKPALHPGRLRPALALLLCAPALLSPAQAGGGTDASLTGRLSVRRGTSADTAPARVIVQYRADSALMSGGGDATTKRALAATGRVQPLHATTLAGRLGVGLADRHVLGARMQSLEVSDGSVDADTLARRLAAQPDVEWAVPVRRRQIASATAPNDPRYGSGLSGLTPASGQWYLRAPAWPVVSGMDAPTAWARTTGSASVVVAVLDTGVLTDHPDLAGKLVAGHDFVRASVSNDGDGADSDPTDPGDWCTSDSSASSWHGTQTASLVGARTDDGVGMAGTAPAVLVQPVRVLGQCGGYDDDIIAGMRYAGGLSTTVSNATPAKVINMSLGGTPGELCNSAYQSAITALNAAGVSVVVAAGNEALAVGSPANCSGVIAVAALRHVGTKVGFSSLGSEVTLSAPGGNCINETGSCLYPIITATNSGTRTAVTHTWTDGYDYAIGTSFSAPMVAGTAALMLSANPALTPAQITSLLQSTARAFPTIGAQDSTAGTCQAPGSTAQSECYCTTSTCGAGMLDTGAAVAAAVGATPTVRAVIAASSPNPTAGSTLTLSGASSSRGVSGWSWQLLAGGTGSASFTSATSAAQTTLQITQPGSFIVALTTTDGHGGTDTAQATLVSPPTVSISGASSVTVGSSVTLSATSTAYGGRSIASRSWRIASGSSRATISGTSSNAATVSATASGAISIELTVTDSEGSSSTQTFALTAGGSSGSASGGGAQGAAGGLALGLLAAWLRRQRHPRRPSADR